MFYTLGSLLKRFCWLNMVDTDQPQASVFLIMASGVQGCGNFARAVTAVSRICTCLKKRAPFQKAHPFGSGSFEGGWRTFAEVRLGLAADEQHCPWDALPEPSYYNLGLLQNNFT